MLATSPAENSSRLRPRVTPTRLVLMVLLCLVILYVGYYFAITRWSYREARITGDIQGGGYYYVPVSYLVLCTDSSWQIWNDRLEKLYLPLRFIEESLTGNKTTVPLPLMGISPR